MILLDKMAKYEMKNIIANNKLKDIKDNFENR